MLLLTVYWNPTGQKSGAAGRSVEQAQCRLGTLVGQVSGRMTAHGFNLVLEKTEAVDKERILTLCPTSIGESVIESKSMAN